MIIIHSDTKEEDERNYKDFYQLTFKQISKNRNIIEGKLEKLIVFLIEYRLENKSYEIDKIKSSSFFKNDEIIKMKGEGGITIVMNKCINKIFLIIDEIKIII